MDLCKSNSFSGPWAILFQSLKKYFPINFLSLQNEFNSKLGRCFAPAFAFAGPYWCSILNSRRATDMD